MHGGTVRINSVKCALNINFMLYLKEDKICVYSGSIV
jgi:hypothetical protein